MKVAVVGLGSTGSMALWLVSRMPGVTAVGFEQFGIGHPHGGYSGESRLFRTVYHEGEKYIPLLARARTLWSKLERASGRRIFHDYGVLTVGREADAAFARLRESARTHRLAHERLGTAALRARYPQLDIADDEVGLLDVGGGALRPELGVISAIEAARREGAAVREHEAVGAIVQTGHGVDLITASGSQHFDRVIVTAGSWSKLLVPEIADLTETRRIVLTWFVPRDAGAYSPEALPCFIRDRDGFHVFGAPIVDGYSAKISRDVEGPLDVDRPENMSLRVEPEDLSAFGARVQRLFPGVLPEPVRYSAHHDSFTSDKTPIIDSRRDVIVVAGLSGHGFKLAPALGEIAAQLAVDGVAPLRPPDFSIAAHAPVHPRTPPRPDLRGARE